MSFIVVPPGTRLNSMLAGYFSKTVTCLVSRRAAECVGWFQSNPRFVNRLVEHVGDRRRNNRENRAVDEE